MFICWIVVIFLYDIELSNITSHFLTQNVLWVWNIRYLVNTPRNRDTVSVDGTVELMKLFPCLECVFGAQLL